MNTRTLELLTWVLVYGGLLGVCLGLALFKQGGPAGLLWISALVAALGLVLIYVRSRIKPKK
jgi:predicted MFS family arabinose efflux permease